MRVGWIGMGAMGEPMASRVLAGGCDLIGHARHPERYDGIRAAGGIVTDDARAVADAADLLCVAVFSEAQLAAVLFDDAVLAAMRAGAILAIHSTVAPVFVRDLAARRPDIAALDAGFSGGPNDALAGRLTLMVGGDGETLSRARPVFGAYASKIAHVGPLGSGMALKLVNNLMFAAQVAIARDALRLVAAEQLDVSVAIDVLRHGSAASRALDVFARGDDAEAAFGAIRPYLDKDVPVARRGNAGRDLGALDAPTRGFGDLEAAKD